MRIVRLASTVVLLLFVGATIVVLVAQEVALSSSTDEPIAVPQGVADEPTTQLMVEGIASSDRAAVAEVPGSVTSQGEAPITQPPISSISDTPQSETDLDSRCVVDAIYFHNTHRCYTCKKIEETAKAIMETEFADEFESGRLRWSTINMEEERQYIGQYNLSTPTLILARTVDDEPADWIPLGDTWRLIGSELRFSMYITDRTRTFLGECP